MSRVYKKSDHTDPGVSFPWAYYMALVNGSDTITEPEHKEEEDMQFIRSRQTGTIYALTPLAVTPMKSAKTWMDMVKAYGLDDSYTVSLDDGDIASIAADAAARRKLLADDLAAALKAGA